ncbi:putative thiamine-phosphate pyrophosphorylase [Burkholderia pseudomallei BPC006]|nr:putative thiamine-phosphate pyrophosphorylase [Burkholderia pseudomallei BPC006]
MSVDSLAEARNAGAYGIAAIRAFWESNVDRS